MTKQNQKYKKVKLQAPQNNFKLPSFLRQIWILLL